MQQIDPLMVPAGDLLSKTETPEPETPNLEVVTADTIRLDYWMDKSLNPSLRGLLLDWVLAPEQAHLKKQDPIKQLSTVWKKARSLNETRVPLRLSEKRVKAIALTVVDAMERGKAALMRNTHYKEDILKHRDPEAYRAEQAKAGHVSGLARRGNAQKRWRAVWRDVQRGELTQKDIAVKHGITDRHVRNIKKHFQA